MISMQQEKGNKKESNIANVEILISKILRVGVLISGTCIAIGLIIFLITGESGYPGIHILQYYPLYGVVYLLVKHMLLFYLVYFCLY
ncbi:hypothetical protein IIE_05295 [Bacillus cereus VD045]|nr:hypothetical protein IIE_05295 [Bacillus cereus VD045]